MSKPVIFLRYRDSMGHKAAVSLSRRMNDSGAFSATAVPLDGDIEPAFQPTEQAETPVLLSADLATELMAMGVQALNFWMKIDKCSGLDFSAKAKVLELLRLEHKQRDDDKRFREESKRWMHDMMRVDKAKPTKKAGPEEAGRVGYEAMTKASFLVVGDECDACAKPTADLFGIIVDQEPAAVCAECVDRNNEQLGCGYNGVYAEVRRRRQLLADLRKVDDPAAQLTAANELMLKNTGMPAAVTVSVDMHRQFHCHGCKRLAMCTNRALDSLQTHQDGDICNDCADQALDVTNVFVSETIEPARSFLFGGYHAQPGEDRTAIQTYFTCGTCRKNWLNVEPARITGNGLTDEIVRTCAECCNKELMDTPTLVKEVDEWRKAAQSE